MSTNFTNPNLVTPTRTVNESANAQLLFNYDKVGHLAIFLVVDGANLLHIPQGPTSIFQLSVMSRRPLTINSSPKAIANAIFSLNPSFVYFTEGDEEKAFYHAQNITFPAGGLKVENSELKPFKFDENGNMNVINMPLNAHTVNCRVTFATYRMIEAPSYKPDEPPVEFLPGWVGVKVGSRKVAQGHSIDAVFYTGDPAPSVGIVVTDLETEIIGENLMGADAATVAWAFMSEIEGTNLGMGPVYMEGVSGRGITTGDDGVVWIPVAYWFAAN